ncbi:NADP-dependent oxidoreductase [Niabella aquatica]
MKAIILNETGGADQLTLSALPLPEIKENEVLIKVKAISINPVDYKTRTSQSMVQNFYGGRYPVVLGWDVSGVVEQSNSGKFKIGDEVFGMINFPGNGSAYAEYVAASDQHIALKPQNISHEDAAAATLAALTAWQVLVAYGGLTRGQKVLVHAASGGVGHYATQIAKALGAYVIGTSSAKNRDFVLANGADEHIDYVKEDLVKAVADVDLILDTIGGQNALKSVRVAKEGGKVICITNGNFPQEYLDEAAGKNVALFFILVKSSATDMEIIAEMLEKGTLKSHISEIFPFEEMPNAHKALETGRTVGKIVITP